MYERFTDRARKVMKLTNNEAQRLYYERVESGHLLLGLIQQAEGTALNVLTNLKIDPELLLRLLEPMMAAQPETMIIAPLPQSRGVKYVLENSIQEAISLNHEYIGTEHLLLGLIREEEGVAGQILREQGLTLEAVRTEVLRVLEQSKPPENPD